ncbi:MAG: carbonic anhydrase, partial [Ignavibacteriaceae bacterium]|nr:carbonic anhydrase [Ignavibacteriaceae bacterium]
IYVMKRAVVALLSFFVIVLFSAGTIDGNKRTVVSGAEAQKKLIEGNKRFVESMLTHPEQTIERRVELAAGQQPFAVIVSCSDSRVPPEIVFDQGLGDLFVIRLAGNVLNDEAIASIEYAVDHLDVKYIMVLGHERCGAVSAAVQGGEFHGHIGSLVKAIQPAIDMVKDEPGDPVDNAVIANINLVVNYLKASAPILSELAGKGELTITGARYDLDDGLVEVLP